MDTVIDTYEGKGGKYFLTFLFRKFNFMLIYLLPYKQSEYVIEVFNKLKELLSKKEFKGLFEVILIDNGTSFSGLTQEDCFLIASHIDSVPRVSLNNISPYEDVFNFIGEKN